MTDLDLRTNRLELRPLTPADAEPLHALWTAPGVRRYLWDDEVIPFDRTRDVVAESTRLFETAGYGLWAARLHSAADLVAFGGYWFFHEPPRLELLFAVAEPHWGQGLANELASALVTFGLTVCGFGEILASTDAPNGRSVRVLTKLGFELERQASSNAGGPPIAIGARPMEVARMFLPSAVRASLVALALGLPLSIAALRIGMSQGVVIAPKVNPYLIGVVIAPVLLAVASAATWVPARRAALVDPARTLRVE
jgi:ribosomal-protein-alanine N-acetyltransferase